jgi:hypothetical protein
MLQDKRGIRAVVVELYRTGEALLGALAQD